MVGTAHHDISNAGDSDHLCGHRLVRADRGAEVVWTRNLSLLLGGTVYTFSIILAVFLVGLGIGSSIGSVVSRHSTRPRLALGGCQLLLMGAIAWTAYALAKSLPYWPVNPSLCQNPWINFQLDLMMVCGCVAAIL
jgi:spermidine synthase